MDNLNRAVTYVIAIALWINVICYAIEPTHITLVCLIVTALLHFNGKTNTILNRIEDV